MSSPAVDKPAVGNLAAPSAVIPYAKKSGITSFSSLGCIKKALHTKKVGHTGTLDSFAEGLLVVLSGSLTRLVPFFTLFDKTYEAIISFGEETDTLDPSGTVIRSAPLPALADFSAALERFRGNLMQSPPAYSAIHVNGKRAAELAREGRLETLPERPVTVFKSEILETRVTPENKLQYVRVLFHVSKGTYIRSLARDIALASNSAAHLIGLKRTKAGCFSLEQAALADELEDFTVDSVIRRGKNSGTKEAALQEQAPLRKQTEQRILSSLLRFDPETAEYCGFIPLTLREKCRTDFINGKPLKPDFFEDFEIRGKTASALNLAVFLPDRTFCGIVQTTPSKRGGIERGFESGFQRLKYGFVVSDI